MNTAKKYLSFSSASATIDPLMAQKLSIDNYQTIFP
jgi:hypothetical protein